ncbi:MAG: hypothetical protein KKF46_07730 [Nanoarchaeota archaeon]|nr:hypothetical protein [Nanoarchaeota archaeon]MBU1322218.1 hypothetical protein [Nanoarchaeota archaeon]MBU1597759.1 hypothetical protein [Nanoarchaeota archaeon]MBU2442023.1 hypothetical protein [Nanoarchaeota archaeon]
MTNNLYVGKLDNYFIAGYLGRDGFEIVTPNCIKPEEVGRFINANEFWLHKWYGVDDVSTSLPAEAKNKFSEMDEQEKEKFVSEVNDALKGKQN